jgi:succinate dehydrogenase / fumarate reductase, cytochrome b subunit
MPDSQVIRAVRDDQPQEGGAAALVASVWRTLIRAAPSLALIVAVCLAPLRACFSWSGGVLAVVFAYVAEGAADGLLAWRRACLAQGEAGQVTALCRATPQSPALSPALASTPRTVLRLASSGSQSVCSPAMRVSAEGLPILSAKECETANVGAGLWKGIGMWAWVLFRISGLVLVAYLFVDIWVISQGRIGGPGDLDNLFETFDKPFPVFLALMLVSAVMYHALNGVRIVLMDFGVGIRQHKAVFWVCMVVAVAALSLSAWKASGLIF